MPKSKAHSKRRAKLKARNEAFESLIKKRVAKFNALPEETKLGLMAQWQQRLRQKHASIGGVSETVEEPVE